MPTDRQLLKQFAEDGDQQAFAQIVENLVHIAYYAAFANLEREDLARDASQLAFLELAKQAGRLPESPQLGGWIHSTARNISRKILRSEIRRCRREQTYVDEMNTQTMDESKWAELTPAIHDSLDKLNPDERAAVILRFFQKQSLADIGAAQQISSDAARMRINRALERMNRHLVRKGITSTTAALAAALPAHAALAAPAGMAATISATVLASAGTTIAGATLTGVLLTIMKAKTLIITAVAATTVVGGSVYLAKQSDKSAPETVVEKSEPSIQPSRQVEDKTIDTTVSTAPPADPITEERTEPRSRRGGVKQFLADMMKNPTLNKAQTASQRAVIGVMYEDFIGYLNLSPEEAETFIDLIMYRQMKFLGLLTAGDISADERAELNQELLTADELFKNNMAKFLNNPEDSAEFQYYEKTVLERMMLSQVDQSLSGTEAALSDETYKAVLAMMYDEKNKFLSDDLLDPTNVDSNPERYTQEKLQTYANETKQLNREILAQAEQMLTEEQYAEFAASLKNITEMQFMQLRQVARLVGGWE